MTLSFIFVLSGVHLYLRWRIIRVFTFGSDVSISCSWILVWFSDCQNGFSFRRAPISCIQLYFPSQFYSSKAYLKVHFEAILHGDGVVRPKVRTSETDRQLSHRSGIRRRSDEVTC